MSVSTTTAARVAALALLLAACTQTDPGDAGSAAGDGGASDAGASDAGDSDGGAGDGGAGDGGSGDGGSGDGGGLDNRLVNGGFELGESWTRPAGFVNHAWAATGDPIYDSPDSFSAYEGGHSEKFWGLYWGELPNDSEQGLSLVDLSEGDTHVLSAMVFTASDDAIGDGTRAVLFLQYLDADGAVIEDVTSDPVDGTWPRDTWQALRVEATVPPGAASGRLGLRFSLDDWSATGSVYLDDLSWTSTGTGAVDGERLLVWNDEFSGAALDEDRWTRLELPAYTYNNELQEYTASDANADVADGLLTITARQESDGSITSARLVTEAKAEWTYGRMEAMVRVPSGVGTWPAFWMLPTDRVYGEWPDSGEIDVMEHVGCDLGVVYQSVHTGAYNHLIGTQRSGSTTRDAADSFHLYAVDWRDDGLVMTVDGETVLVFDNDGQGDPDTWPFDQDFHLLLNLAWGGDWGGYCGVDYGALPQDFVVDWVRVYQ